MEMIDEAGIDSYMNGAVDSGEIPGAVAIVADRERTLYSGAFGLMDSANNVAMKPDTIFEIFSMTKPFTTVAVMMLIEEGRMALDQPVSDFLPEYANPEVITGFDEDTVTYETKPADRVITVRHLLTHTAGFGYIFFSRIVNLLTKKTGKSAIELPLLFEPGTRWMYGVSTRILGKAVEEISGKTLEEVLRERICGPLNLPDTCYILPEEKYSRIATTHRRKDGVLVEDAERKEPSVYVFGDTGLYSTAEDYIMLLRMLLNGGELDGKRLLSRDSVDMMTRNQIGGLTVEKLPGIIPDVARSFPLGAGRDKFGLGFQITAGERDDPSRRSPGTCSWAGMRNTFFWFDPRKGIAAVLMMHVVPFYDEACLNVLRGFEEAVYRGY